MPTPDLLELEVLLRPVSDDSPTGSDLRDDISPDSLYYRIKDARAAARATERAAAQSEDPSGAPPADWDPVLELAPRITTEAAKDLEVVAWWIEALARSDGFAGLRDGFRLVTGLVRDHWDGLYPQPDEDGVSTRVAPLTGLNGEEGEGTLIAPIGMIPIADGDEAYGLWHYKLARELAKLTDDRARAEREATNGVSEQLFQNAVLATSAGFFQNLVEDLDACLAAYAEMCSALEERCGSDAPPSSNIRNALAEVQQALRYLTKDVLIAPAPAGASPAETAPAGDGAASAAPAAASGPVRTRADALHSLRQVARFFRETEPHSPVPYLIDQAIRWSHTALPELMKELIPDEDALGRFNLVTGIQSTSPSNDDD